VQISAEAKLLFGVSINVLDLNVINNLLLKRLFHCRHCKNS